MISPINTKGTELVKGQLIASIFLLISVVISILLLYDNLERREKKEGLFSQEEAYQILIIYRLSFIIIFGYLFYNNYQNLQLREEQHSNLQPAELQLIAALFAVIATIIPLYTDIVYPNQSMVTAEEPTL